DFFQRCAQVNGGGKSAVKGAPGDGLRERVINFESAGAGLELVELLVVVGREASCGNLLEVLWRNVAEGERVGQFCKRGDTAAGVEGSAERFEFRQQRIGDTLRAGTWNGPADSVRGDGHNQAHGGAGGRVEAEIGMRSQSCKNGAGARVVKLIFRKETRRLHGLDAEAGKHQRTPRQVQDGAEDFFVERGPVFRQRLKEIVPACAVFAQMVQGWLNFSPEQHGGSVVKRMREGRGGMDPLESVL